MFFVIKRIVKILVELAAIAIVGLIVLIVFAGIRLSMGPLSLDILTPYIERGFNAKGWEFKVNLGGTVLAWSEGDRDLDIIVRQVRVTNQAGAEQAFVPELAIGLSLRALVVGEFRPTRLEFLGLRLKLVRGADGRIGFGDPSSLDAGGDKEKARGAFTLGGDVTSAVLGGLQSRPAPGHPLHYLRRISFSNAELEFEDLGNNFRLTSPGSDLTLTRDTDGVDVTARLHVTMGDEMVPVDVTGSYHIATQKINMRAHFGNLQLARLAKLGEAFAPLAAARFPVDGEIGLTMGTDGQIENVTLEAVGRGGKIHVKEFYANPIPITALRIKASVGDNLKRFKLHHLTADLAGARIGLKGEARRNGKFTAIVLNATARDVSVSDLKRLWPKGVASRARTWIQENLEGGKIGRADMRVALKLEADEKGVGDAFALDSVDGRFEFNHVTVHYLRPLPPIKEMAGRATVTKDAIVIENATGRLQGLGLEEGKVTIGGFDSDRLVLKVEALAKGPLRAALALLAHPGLGLIKGMGVNPNEISGDMATRLAIELPLQKVVSFDNVEVVAAASLRDVKVPKVALGADVTDGSLTLQANKRNMDVTGTIKLGGVPVRLAWTENFYSGAKFRSRYGVKGVIDDAGRKRLGLAAKNYVTGPVDFDLVITRFDKRRIGISGTLDVKQAKLLFNEIEWAKKPGVPGYARFSLNVLNDKVQDISRLSVKAGDLEVIGTARLAADGITIERFRFSKLVFGESDFSVTGQARSDGGLDLAVTGSKIDIRPFLQSRRKEDANRPLSIKVDVDQVRVGPGLTISSVQGSMSRTTGDWRNMTIRGKVGKNHIPVLVFIKPAGTKRNLNIISNDAGAILRAINITDNIRGGRLTIRGAYDDTKPGAPLTGTFRVKNFQVLRASLMTKLLSVLSFTGIINTLSGKGIEFEELEASFTKTGDDLRIKEAKAYGSSLGFTAKGWVDLEKEELDISGTVVPAYSVQSILGNIPLLGQLLTGEKGSGVFAATYRLQGSLADPKVSVNPLATVSPGFLRGLFQIFDTPSKKPPAERN